jgi:ABC-type antimicrobial peptide transport system permease subunit
VPTSDPATFIGTASILIAVALVACVVPARRAMRVNPIAALRYD